MLTKAAYTGSASSADPSLAGPMTLNVQSTINASKDIGVLSGKLRIDTVPGEDTVAQFSAAYAGGQAAGLASGHAQGPFARLLGNFSASFSTSGRFANGELGDSAGGGAVELQPFRALAQLDHGQRPHLLCAQQPRRSAQRPRRRPAGRDPLRPRRRAKTR